MYDEVWERIAEKVDGGAGLSGFSTGMVGGRSFDCCLVFTGTVAGGGFGVSSSCDPRFDLEDVSIRVGTTDLAGFVAVGAEAGILTGSGIDLTFSSGIE